MKDIKLAVIGSRTFYNYDSLKSKLDPMKSRIKEMISGGAIGAESLAEVYAKEKKIKMQVIRPEYNVYGKGATIVTNKIIIELSTLVVAFWDMKSAGTKSAIEYARKVCKGIIVYDITKA